MNQETQDASWYEEWKQEEQLKDMLLSFAGWMEKGRVVVVPREEARKIRTNKVTKHALHLYGYDQTKQREW